MAPNNPSPIEIWNRAERRLETEQVYGEFWLRALYGTGPGRLLSHRLLSGRALSRLGGAFQSTRRSARRVAAFVEELNIEMEEFEIRQWSSFNDFFIRRFRPGARRFCSGTDRMPAFCEARYLAFDCTDGETTFPVKGRYLTARAILADSDLGAAFDGGPLLVARLAPVDYHRFHFPDDGVVIEERRISGRLHSVSPLALRHRDDILATNERHVTVLRTSNFGTLAFVEVGAMNVGKIVQTYARGRPFRRGGEKGYFCFGASTILLFGEPGRWTPADDLLELTRERRESLVRLGDEVAASGS